jgi:hypothetical protein
VGQRGIGREAAADLDRVPIGDGAVEQDEVWNGAAFAHQGQAGLVVGSGQNPVARFGECNLDDLQNCRTIVDYEQVPRRHRTSVVHEVIRGAST